MHTIVVIDDDESNNRLLQTVLKDYQVRAARNAEEGIALVRQVQPSLILMDIRMPGMGGVAAIQLIRNDPDLAHTPIIAVTATSPSEDVRDAIASSCDGYVAKPFKPTELRALVQDFLG
jgi:CheY-like chemotaxis protein